MYSKYKILADFYLSNMPVGNLNLYKSHFLEGAFEH